MDDLQILDDMRDLCQKYSSGDLKWPYYGGPPSFISATAEQVYLQHPGSIVAYYNFTHRRNNENYQKTLNQIIIDIGDLEPQDNGDSIALYFPNSTLEFKDGAKTWTHT